MKHNRAKLFKMLAFMKPHTVLVTPSGMWCHKNINKG